MKLRSTSQFEAVYGFKCSGTNPWLKVHAAPNEEGVCRIGLSVSKRVAGGGVHRNRIRRRLREVFRKNRPAFPSGLDFVITVRSAKLPAGSRLDAILVELLLQVAGKARRKAGHGEGGMAGQ